jgi:hypothetical protein
MVEWEQEGIIEDTECNSIDLNDENQDTSEIFTKLARANFADKARVELISNKSWSRGRCEEATPSADPIAIYYRSLSKIPLLKRRIVIIICLLVKNAPGVAPQQGIGTISCCGPREFS